MAHDYGQYIGEDWTDFEKINEFEREQLEDSMLCSLKEYKGVTIYFPEYLKRGSLKSKSSKSPIVNENKVWFRKDKSIVAVTMGEYSIPKILSDNLGVQEGIIKPTIEAVVSEIESVEDLIKKLRTFQKKEGLIGFLHYERGFSEGSSFNTDRYGNYVRVYESKPSNTSASTWHFFAVQRLLKLKEVPENICRDYFSRKRDKDGWDLARFVGTDGDYQYVQEASLEKGINKLFTYYKILKQFKVGEGSE